MLAQVHISPEKYQQRISLAKDAAALIRSVKHWSRRQIPDVEMILIAGNRVMIVTDTKQRIVFAGSNITAMNGYLPSEILGQNWPKFNFIVNLLANNDFHPKPNAYSRGTEYAFFNALSSKFRFAGIQLPSLQFLLWQLYQTDQVLPEAMLWVD